MLSARPPPAGAGPTVKLATPSLRAVQVGQAHHGAPHPPGRNPPSSPMGAAAPSVQRHLGSHSSVLASLWKLPSTPRSPASARLVALPGTPPVSPPVPAPRLGWQGGRSPAQEVLARLSSPSLGSIRSCCSCRGSCWRVSSRCPCSEVGGRRRFGFPISGTLGGRSAGGGKKNRCWL